MFRPMERLALYAAASDKSALHKGRLIWLSAVAVGRRSGEKESGIAALSISLWTERITLDLHRSIPTSHRTVRPCAVRSSFGRDGQTV